MRRSPLLLIGMLLLAACGAPPATQDASSPAPAASLVAEKPTEKPTAEATPTVAVTPTPATLNNEEIAEKLRPATVRVVAEFGETAIDYEGAGAGTGIVYDLANGYVLTNAHVVEGASVVKIAAADTTKTRPARVIGRSQCDDLAVLKVENTADLAEAKLGDSGTVKAGAEVVALGYPLSFDLGTDLSVNAGSVSQLKAQLGKFEELIKIDAAINPGNSGGPLVNRRGEVIGVNSLGIDGAQNQNYAIAISQARPIVEQLQEGKNRHYIGLNLVPNAYSDYFGTEEGMAVIGVASGSPAAQGGIQPADLLLKMEGKTIVDEQSVCDILRSRADGDQLRVQVLRATTGEVLEGEITMGKTGAAAADAPKLEVVAQVDTGSTDQGGTDQGSTDQGGASAEPSAEDEALIVNVTFDDGNAGSWPVGDGDGISAGVVDGLYTVNMSEPNQYVTLAPDESADLGNGVIAALVKAEGTGFAGLAMRYKEENDQRSMYVCWVSGSGKFGCSKAVNNSWTVLVAPTASDAVKVDDYNKMVIAVAGNEFSFELNDQEVAKFSDDTLTRGAWGIYGENFDTAFKAHYDEIAVYSLD